MLTDAEKWYCYSVPEIIGDKFKERVYNTFVKGIQKGSMVDDDYPEVSEPVFHELQRIWKEREGQKELYSEVLQMDKEKENEEKFMSDWRNQTKLGIQAMNKVIKALDKQNKLLRKLIKKQNTKRDEKTIM